jgi:DNA-binding GntR family transcriptional regulator
MPNSSMDSVVVMPSLIDQVHLRMVDAIAEGVLVPGERLTQEQVAERLNVSRQPVSHALQLLKRQGLAVEHGRRGLSVALIDPKTMRELYQLRAVIDGLACRLAAERVACGQAPVAEIEGLKERLSAGDLCTDAPIHNWIAVDVAFHQSIYVLSGNVALAETVSERWPHFKRCMGTSLSTPVVRAGIWVEHAAIADAILSGAARAAESAATHHAEKAGSALYQRLQEEAAVQAPARRA